MQKAFLERDFRGKVNSALIHRVRGMKCEGPFLRKTIYLYRRNYRNKADFKRQWHGVIIARFGRKVDLVYYWVNSIEVDLKDTTSKDKIPDALGCDGTLRLQLTDNKFPIRYLVDQQTLVLLAEIKMGFCRKIKMTWVNTDTRLGHNAFFRGTPTAELRSMSWEVAMLLKTFFDIWNWNRKAHRPKRFKS